MYDYSDSDFSRKTITIMELQALISRVGALQKTKLILVQEIKFLKSKLKFQVKQQSSLMQNLKK